MKEYWSDSERIKIIIVELDKCADIIDLMCDRYKILLAQLIENNQVFILFKRK